MENTLTKALRILGTEAKLFNQLLVNMNGQNGRRWTAEFAKFVRCQPCWVNSQASQTNLLELISTIVVPATTGNLVAKEKFVRDTGRKAKVKISYLGDNFTEWFLSGSGKTEDPGSEQTLRYHKLRQSSVDGPIIGELGGAEKSETTLLDVFFLMEKQGKGEDGVLLNNGYANIFYIKDQNGVLRAVFVSWNDVGWYVFARSVGGPGRWDDGRQVFSRLSVPSSVLESSEPSAPA